MTTSIDQINNEPILVITFDDDTSEAFALQTYLRSVDAAKRISGLVYRIVDLRQAENNYGMLISTIKQVGQAMSGAAAYPEMALAFVVEPHMAHADSANCFTDMDEALLYAQTQLTSPIMSL